MSLPFLNGYRWTNFFVLLLAGALGVHADEPIMLEAQGLTMGSSFSIKVCDPPNDFPDDWQLAVDREFRAITDQMSTYLPTSEISRFNQSQSIDWYDCSAELAMVVHRGQSISKMSGGAFDMTILPIVKAWSFGPGKKRLKPPSDEEIQSLRNSVGYQQLEVRLDPPALKKKIPALEIDLNAIAPGHGADRIVKLLQGYGAINLFVEVGGEVRVCGDKRGKPWTVGIEQPDPQGVILGVAFPVRDRSMATSGDYRSFFEFEGKRYSHTIDPRTCKPVTHHLASVTVLAEDCMSADGFSTTLSVLGETEGFEFAKRHSMDALFMIRSEDGIITKQGTGVFASYADQPQSFIAKHSLNSSASTQFLSLLPIVAIVLGLVIAAMAIGVMFGRRAISGSCGGLTNSRDADGNLSCSLCSNPGKACKDLLKQSDASPSS